MKPSFALDLRDEQVALLHRTSRGWQEVGQTRFDAPDMAEALAYMRSTALGLSPRGISTKVIIPNDQILYTQITAPGPDGAKRKKQVRAGLEGLTPYALDDLVYDTHGSGPEVQVAAVARETLEQAEAFAAEHRFNPVSFVAVPDNGAYLSEPFFGPSRMSPALLSEGEKVERDGDPVHVVPREMPRSAEPVVAEPVVAEPVVAEPAVAEPVVADTVAAEAVVAAPAAEASAVADSLDDPPAVSEASGAGADPVEAPRATADAGAAELAPLSLTQLAVPEPRATDLGAPQMQADPSPAEVPVPEAPMALDVPGEDLPPAPSRPLTAAELKKSLAAVPEPEDDVPAGPSEAVRAALAARRGAAGAAGAPALGAAPVSGAPRPATRPAALPETATAKTPPPLQASKPTAAARPSKTAEAMVTAPAIPGLGRRKSPAPAASQAATPATEASAATASAATARPAGGAKPMTDLKGRPVQMRGKPRYLGLILTGILLVFLVLIAAWSSFFLAGLSTDETAPASTAVTQAEPSGAPAAEAVTADQSASAATGQAAATAADPAADPAAADVTAADEAAADGQDATVAAASEADTVAATEAATDAASPAPAAEQPVATETATADAAADTAAADSAATPDAAAIAAATDPAATTAAPAASAETTPATDPAPALAPDAAVSAEAVATAGQTAGDTASDEIFLAAAEPPTALSDPAALPAAAAGDTEPLASPDPPPFGTVYKFDAEGRIIPTAEGILSPDGVLLVAGAPKVVPPGRPAAIAALAPPSAPVAAEAAAPAADAAAQADAPADTGASPGAIALGLPQTQAPGASAETLPDVAEPVLEPDPEMKGFRPKARPASLVPAVAPAEDPAASDAVPDPRLASFRPRARTTSAVLTAMAGASASTAGLSDAEATAEQAASALAVGTSALPPARPAALAQAVNKAVAAAAAAAAQPEVKVAAAAAPSAEASVGDEPEVTTPMPKIPTSANVAKVATEKNALPTSKLALIGIFGADGSRYAYVRLNNGTLKKVKVGDTLDGGRVVAISASDLRYQKGGKEVVLAMPRDS